MGISDIPVVGQIYDAITGKATPQQPGVGGKALNANNLQRDPTTGLYYDPTTGTSYTDPNGYTPVTDPNVAQQVAANYAQSRAFLGQLPGLEKERQGAVGGQVDLTHQLQGTIAGTTPSVAGTQLQHGLGEIAAQQLSQASGTAGPTAPLMAMLAQRNTGAAEVQTNQAQAMLRAKEIADAQALLEKLLASRAAGAQTAYNGRVAAGGDFAGLAANGQATQQDMNQKTNQYNMDLFTKYLGAAVKGAGDAGSAGGQGGGGAAALAAA